MNVLDINGATGQVVKRDFTDEELEQRKIDLANDVKWKKSQEDKAAKKEAAETKLAALGLTADDLKALGL